MMIKSRMGNALALAVAALVLGGCASSGMMAAGNVTNVDLAANDYRVVATDVGGEATAHYVIGVSAPYWFQMSVLAIARVGGSEFLYRDALQDLWRNFESEHGSTDGRSLALANLRYDFDALNLLVYTRPRVSVRADVIEFTR